MSINKRVNKRRRKQTFVSITPSIRAHELNLALVLRSRALRPPPATVIAAVALRFDVLAVPWLCSDGEGLRGRLFALATLEERD